MDDTLDNMENMTTTVSFRQKLQDPEYRRKFIHTLVLFCSNIFLGIRTGQHSSAFLDLAQITGTNIEQASVFYTAMCVGSLVGNFCVGFLFDKLKHYRLYLLSATCILGAFTTVAVPWSTNYLLTSFIFFLNQVFHGGYDTGGDANMMDTWGMDGKMFMLFFHFCYSVGAIISPFTVQPFLSHLQSGNASYCQHFMNLHPNETNTEAINHTIVLNDCKYSESQIHYAYLIAGLLCLLSGIAFAAEGCLYSTEGERTQENVKSNDDHRNPQVLPKWLTILVLGLTSAMYFFHCATGGTLVGYIMAFSVQGLGWSKDQGALLNAVFSGGYSATRLLGVIVSKWVSPAKMLFVHNTIIVVSIAGLWSSVVQGIDWGVWLCIFFSAVGFSVVFPTGIIYLENDVMKVTGRIASVVWVAGNIQGFVNPLLVGFLMHEVSSMWYIYLALIERCLCLISFCLLVLVVRIFVSKIDTEAKLTTEISAGENEQFIDSASGAEGRDILVTD